MKTRTLLFFILFIGQLSNANSIVVTDPVMPFLPNLYRCDANGNTAFDLTVQTPIILGSQSGLSADYNVTYHLTFIDANLGANAVNANPFISLSNQQTIYVRVQNNTTSSFATGSFAIEVIPQVIPTFITFAPLCQNSNAPSFPTASTDGITGTWSPSTIDTSVLGSTTFLFTPDPGQCATSVTMTISVVPASTLTLISPISTTNQILCYNQPITNIVYQLSGGATVATVTGLPVGVISWVMGTTLTISGTPTASGLSNFSATTTGGCGIQSLTGTITVLPYPRINTNYVLEDVLCVDYNSNTVINPMLLQVSSGYFGPNMNHTYQWYLNGVAIAGATNATYLVNTPDQSGATRNYSVEFTDVTAMGCQGMSSDFQVIQSGPASPIGIGYSIVNNSGVQTLTVEVEGYGTYKYSLDGGYAQFSPIFTNVALGTHTIVVSDTEGGTTNSCSPVVISNIDVNLTTTPPPTGNTSQIFIQGATLADLSVSGQNIGWYSGANKNATTTSLPLNTLLVNGTTYYASQKIGGYESISRLPVLVQLSLNNAQFELKNLSFEPNPVINNLNLKSNEIIDEVLVYNLVGQLILNQKFNKSDVQIDLSTLNSGTYFVKVTSSNKQKTVKIVKK
ncbi:T9SS type A sorting domain-containing protein [Flavobacterium sp. SUN052]|uniref:T9SS type A sorting domain-containing protein n=1 Tax=Flavobacterium sp. SUN052 TaxID=3002441 RepID=UPI00237D6190|nr:T9SS type A sorting domain-containing protein [Flavobacterium sp. SUN052]MEC4003071.1 T9SS type A sorting domain-containing protein [Flavobacterium sp. SUN052]